MVLTLNNTNTLKADNIVVSGTNLSNLYATINYVNTNSGGISQQDVDDSLAPLISKDIAYNSTISTHISLIDTNTTDIATHTNDIAVLNTKQIECFSIYHPRECLVLLVDFLDRPVVGRFGWSPESCLGHIG